MHFAPLCGTLPEFVVKNSVHVSAGHTPFTLNYVQHPDTPLSLMLRGMNAHIDRFRGRWSEQLKYARQCLLTAPQCWEAQPDKHRRDAPILNLGNPVLLHQAVGSCARGRAPLLKGGGEM
jgi:hypothetical protein